MASNVYTCHTRKPRTVTQHDYVDWSKWPGKELNFYSLAPSRPAFPRKAAGRFRPMANPERPEQVIDRTPMFHRKGLATPETDFHIGHRRFRTEPRDRMVRDFRRDPVFPLPRVPPTIYTEHFQNPHACSRRELIISHDPALHIPQRLPALGIVPALLSIPPKRLEYLFPPLPPQEPRPPQQPSTFRSTPPKSTVQV